MFSPRPRRRPKPRPLTMRKKLQLVQWANAELDRGMPRSMEEEERQVAASWIMRHYAHGFRERQPQHMRTR